MYVHFQDPKTKMSGRARGLITLSTPLAVHNVMPGALTEQKLTAIGLLAVDDATPPHCRIVSPKIFLSPDLL